MTRNKIWAALAAALALTSACAIDDTETSQQQPSVITRADTIVSPALARAVAETYALPGEAPVVRHVRSSSSRADSSGRPAMFGFNFEEGGFVVIAADFEFSPILAFADEGTIDVANPLPGQDEWLDNTRLAIEAVRGRNTSDDNERSLRIGADFEERLQWTPLLDRLASRGDVDSGEVSRAREVIDSAICMTCPPPPPQPEACTSYTKQNPPQLTLTTWGQGCNYNQKTPLIAGGPCGHALTGCTATALGQVVFRHQHAPGHGYMWQYVPLGPTGVYAAGPFVRAALLRDLGDAASSVYGANATTATTANAAAALQSFGYATVLGSLPYGLSNVAIPEIDAARPLLIRGASDSGGHIWVVDTYIRYKGLPAGCKVNASHSQKYFRYNWGWDGGSNGYYKEMDYGGYTGNRKYITARPI
jgi:hypothetical protein